jgi:uncharacterized damage-inducible protein DinB
LTFVEEHQIDNERVNRICGHILVAQVLWIKRIRPVEISNYSLWENYSLGEMKKLSETSYAVWKNFLNEYPDNEFSKIIPYTNTQGLAFETPVNEIVRHVLYHGAYHRGQLAILIRDLGFTPPYTDYVAFVRGQ